MYKHYNMKQLVLPMDLERKLQENDVAYHIHHLVESIPEEAFAKFYSLEGAPSYHPRMMLKIILCAYTQSVFSVIVCCSVFLREQRLCIKIFYPFSVAVELYGCRAYS